MVDIEKNYAEFKNILSTYVKRDGIGSLLVWLDNSDLKTAPASTKYHCSFPGGLVQHCLNVYYRLKKLLELEYPSEVGKDENGETFTSSTCPYSEETIAIVALLHDISKVNFYEVQERNTKDENGQWIKVPFYAVKDESKRLIFGSHSINSVYMLSKFLNLTYEEELSILYHMGGLDTSEDKITVKNVVEAFHKSTLSLLLHQADAYCTYIVEGPLNNE